MIVKLYFLAFSFSFPESDVDGEGEKPKKTKVKKKTKKSEPKDLSMFEENAPSIFDDPLSALGNT